MNQLLRAKMRDRAVLEVDLKLVQRNGRLLKKMAGSGFFCPMVKADAYGHGAGPIVKALSKTGVKQVGVISLKEAELIREYIKDVDTLIFGPILNKTDLSEALKANFVLVCSNWEDLKELAQVPLQSRIHLKFDTGFSRLGFPLSSAEKLADFLKNSPQIQLEGLVTQLVSSENIGDETSLSFSQIQQFLKLKSFFSVPYFHALNTAGLISQFIHREFLNLGARPGIGLYGLKPKVFFKNQKAKNSWNNLSLSLVSSLKSYIVDLHRLKPGEGVSYGAFWKAKQPSQIATVSLGYGDGFLRAFGSNRKVLFRGKERPVVGTVCMDFMMIDVTEDFKDSFSPPVQIGEEVVFFGRQKSAFLCPQKQAGCSGSIAYELFSRLGPRVKRVYKNL